MKRIVGPCPEGQAEAEEREAINTAHAEKKQELPHKPPTTRKREPEGPRTILPPEFMNVIKPALGVGALTGVTGLITGGAMGIVRGLSAPLFGTVMGLQWFVLGFSFSGSRRVAMNALVGDNEPKGGDKVKASTMAGCFTGIMGGSLRGPRNIIPGAIMFSIFGAGGQAIVNSVNWTRKPQGQGVLFSKWSPVTPLTDQEYEKMLEEKLLRVEAQIAIIDEDLQELRTPRPKSEKSEK
ncbi:hypothetical protein B0H67DRAFT_287143 [Lasiosphaeris hirsuta]|uniref:Uncharacterized protein n=1 Tax=Lasiosphaeris hirsuta TaxID=260670 RepID=A0AA40DQ26_9PEZI|nr:hypothetical protein B0H67DRAFT_287143 [Lasiosphaeris hirsuta]